ncbi:hypothetical protein ABID70_002422 [Clavibacter michiganensis]|uniref:hypothetical protein n=1 Tax=Clavibacter michiganensis TaxID=28447 RepID=UPI001AE2AA54|nr:hypothetical protein [Clavibacter michiganensis]MBP2456898.1 hypothetical protein [Clavibacter michiganensis]MDQ0409468.1 hypothetical protein [Clavibacter michiganensis]
MSEDAWRPAVPTGREDALTETFPAYMREAVFKWMKKALGIERDYVRATPFVEFQNAARTDLGFRGDGMMQWNGTALPHLRKISDADFTNLVSYLVAQAYHASGQHPLDAILSEGGSAWTVTRWKVTGARLTKRVPDGVQQAAASVLSATDAASAKLQEAWLDAYGTNPRASVAYSNAVIAVETAVLSVIKVTKTDATLADVFSILEAKKPKWELIFRDSDRAPGATTLGLMLRTLWRGHASRHGRPDYEDASLEEARAAVILAATLVQWLTSGVVVPVES